MKKYVLGFILTFVVILSMPPASTGVHAEQFPTRDANAMYPGITIYVDDSNTEGPWNGTHDYPYRYIRDGIANATDGDTVYVFNGVYNETVTVNKSITFRGQQQENTIIDGGNDGTVVHITAANVLVRRFTIRNSGGFSGNAGIAVDTNTTAITECTVYRTRTAIAVENSSQTTITSSKFYTNGFGIATKHSSFITFDQCVFYHSAIGIYLFDTHCANITNSYATTNGIGILSSHSSNIVIEHTATSDNDDNEGGMFFTDSIYITIRNCNIENNGVGVNLVRSSACYIDRCNFSQNTHFALKLMESLSSIMLTHCLMANNIRYGIYAEDSAFTIQWSNFEQNAFYGIWATSSRIDARYDWWGSRSGPAHTGLRLADRDSWDRRSIEYAPWLTFPMPESGSDWQTEKIFQPPANITAWPEQLSLPGNDTDGDGAPDWWEIKWGYSPLVPEDHTHLDPDGDALTNLEECDMAPYNASPFHKDVFLEFDWVKAADNTSTNKPGSTNLSAMIAAFAKRNITLHVDTGNLGGGEEIPSRPFVSDADIVGLYWDYFLHNDLNNPRQRIFHYGLVCDRSDGNGFAVFGWDNLNSFVIAAQQLVTNQPRYQRDWLIVSGSMHELGHTFGLIAKRFTAIDNRATLKPIYKEFWQYLKYKSVMNYLYTYSSMDYSDGSQGRNDFNDWGTMDFSFFKNTNFHAFT
jgi:parallel beta-helix repeat protein